MDAAPYAWPYDGTLVPERTALLLIDWQVDFCGPGGYVDAWATTSRSRGPASSPRGRCSRPFAPGAAPSSTPARATAPTSPTARRTSSGARSRSARASATRARGRILVRGEPGWQIVPEVAPIEGELIIDKPGKGAFYATDLDLLLRTRGITHIVFTGITTDVCVHTTMRDANDRGYECLLLSDCTGATDPGNYDAALKMVTMQGGVFGAIAPSSAFLAALEPALEAGYPPPRPAPPRDRRDDASAGSGARW